ncbi:hypothetical protein PG987_016058 [Apiospora arundinis]
MAAPSHQSGGRDSAKMAKPRIAVMTKLADVFMMDTWVVELPRARALVKSVHICRKGVHVSVNKTGNRFA